MHRWHRMTSSYDDKLSLANSTQEIKINYLKMYIYDNIHCSISIILNHK